MYIVSDAVKGILEANDLMNEGKLGEEGKGGGLRLVQTGLKVFERYSQVAGSPQRYRATQEGLAVTMPFMTRRKVRRCPFSMPVSNCSSMTFKRDKVCFFFNTDMDQVTCVSLDIPDLATKGYICPVSGIEAAPATTT